MSNISSLEASLRNFPKMPSTVSTREHSFLSQFMMSIIIVILLIGSCPYVSSSPTFTDHNNKINYESNGFMLNPNNYQGVSAAGESSLLSPTVQHSFSPLLSSLRYTQPRTYANQFLMSHIDDNHVVIPKWSPRFNNYDQTNDDHDDLDDYFPSAMLLNKRGKFNYKGKIPPVYKRKQLTKPPMEVLNEIVNSIYLKR
ncbi:unnamed protein product [Rotaria sordida]|uniref:Uncharacterized protein n=1 Tax=Rotaria sordida TaxID=392033 RepID=A0A814X628_9BILA|nr:unnamed protein product [Rotaria sordida]CAF1211851.1 unnamed protein product [Rotaria sordida]CAF3501032.1 unnamed protein product [Rotaria sordida]CAF3792102.1 unnamed protein product [Rotaria sordida]